MSRKRHNSFIDGVGGGPVAPTGSAVTNATVAGNIIHARSVRNKSVPGPKLAPDGRDSMTIDVRSAIRRGDALFQSTDPSYNIRGPIGAANLMVFATFEGLTPDQALFHTRFVGLAEADNVPFNAFENLDGREIAVAMHGTRGTPGSNNKYEAINAGAIVIALPNFDKQCPDKRQSAKAVFWELKPPSLDAFIMPVDPPRAAGDAPNPWDKTPKYLMRSADRTQIVATLAKRPETMVAYNANKRPGDRLVDRHPFDPFVAAVLRRCKGDDVLKGLVFAATQIDTLFRPDGTMGSNPIYMIHQHISQDLRAVDAANCDDDYIDMLIETAASMVQSVLSNFVVGRALAHCSTDDKQLQLLVSRSVIF